MEVYVPILGLDRFGLEPVQPLEIRNLDAPGASSLPPATNVNHALANLLLQIDALYAERKRNDIKARPELKAVFRFPQLNNPELFQGQLMLGSIGLGLLVAAYTATKKPRFTARYDLVCVTGVIVRFPTGEDIYHGRIIDESAGDMEEKLDAFIAFVKKSPLADKKIAFVYGAKTDQRALRERLARAGLAAVEVILADNFNDLLGELFAPPRSRPALFLLPVAAGVIALAGVLTWLALSSGPPAAAEEEVFPQQPSRGPVSAAADPAAEAEDEARFRRAVEDGDLATSRLLIAGGSKVNVPLYKGNRPKIEFLRRACEGPLSRVPPSGRLEENAAVWGVYWEERLPSFSKRGVRSPIGEPALKLSLLKGEPYAFAHFYLNLEPRDAADELSMSLEFYIGRETTFNNQNGDSKVQALEFSMSRFDPGRRYELAWQWQNVGEGAPQWRYWDAVRGWVAAGIKQPLSGRVWHTIAFTGDVRKGNVLYGSLTVDGTAFTVGREAAGALLKASSRYLAAAVQLDGNSSADPYEVYVKNLVLRSGEQALAPEVERK